MDWQYQLISIYLEVCKEYEKKLSNYIVRISNYSNMEFLDEEVMTIYLFGITRGYANVREIYNYTSDHLRLWFPKLPSYVGFVQRINKISHLFELLASSLLEQMQDWNSHKASMLIDAFPIILAHRGRRFKAKARTRNRIE